MATGDEASGLPIGEVLKRARSRQKVDIQTVEEQTKIRTKYLRALENEEWEVLPGHPYAKGFLRTYAQVLGLDGDALVDEYRRTVESSLGVDAPVGFTEPVLERRRRVGDEPRRRWPVRAAVLVVLAGAAAVAAVLVLGSSGNEGKRHLRREGTTGSSGGGDQGSQAGDASPSKPVVLALVTRDDMRDLPGARARPAADRLSDADGGSQGGPLRAPRGQLPAGP